MLLHMILSFQFIANSSKLTCWSNDEISEYPKKWPFIISMVYYRQCMAFQNMQAFITIRNFLQFFFSLLFLCYFSAVRSDQVPSFLLGTSKFWQMAHGKVIFIATTTQRVPNPSLVSICMAFTKFTTSHWKQSKGATGPFLTLLV